MHDSRAVIDIGSNTVRLVVFGGPLRSPIELLNEKVTARLGKGLVAGGELSPASMATALGGLRRFALLLKMKGVRRVDTVATAAVRDAANGEAFLREVAALGLSPRLLSGEEEAALSAAGILGAFPQASGIAADLGGGSLELTVLDEGVPGAGISLPLGTLKLAALRAEGGARWERAVRNAIDGCGIAFVPGRTLYLVGGSFRAFARLAMAGKGGAMSDTHGFELTAAAALRLANRLRPGKITPDLPGVGNGRAATIPDTAALLGALVAETGADRVVFSAWGLREGLLFDSLDPVQRKQDPLVAGVGAFGEAMDIGPSLAAVVAGWTAEVVTHRRSGRENLRLAATMLALASQRVEPNLRAQTLLEWTLSKRWVGITPEGRAMLAVATLANANRPAGLATEFDGERRREAESWGLATRLCRRFSGLAIEAISNSSLDIVGKQLRLNVAPEYAALVTESVEKDLRALAECLGLKPVIGPIAVPA